MKKLLVIAALLVAAGAAFAANPKVAVLDAVLPEKMDKNVAIGVTEKISEELVNSGRFMVLDRTTVAKTLEEIEFQMSGLVSDEDIRKAGDQLSSRLGASFVVTARVSQVGDTFFVSAKMIDIKTGEITAQASDEAEGKIAITLKVAQNVGRKLAAGVKEAPKEPAPVVAAKPKEKEPAPAEARAARPVLEPGTPRSRLAVYYSFPYIEGDLEYNLESAYPGTWFDCYGFAVDYKRFVWKGLYVSAFVTGMLEEITDGFDVESVYEPFLDVQAGIGWGIPLGKLLQLTAGVHGGYASETAGSIWMEYGDSFGGFTFGAEAGIDLIFAVGLVVSLRADYSMASIDTGGTDPAAETYLNFQIGLGWAF